MTKRSKPGEPAKVLQMRGLRVIAQSTDALFFKGTHEVLSLTVRLEFPDGARRRRWMYEYVMRHRDEEGISLLEKYRGPYGDPDRDESVERWTEYPKPS